MGAMRDDDSFAVTGDGVCGECLVVALPNRLAAEPEPDGPSKN